VGTCRWCGKTVRWDSDIKAWLGEDGSFRCGDGDSWHVVLRNVDEARKPVQESRPGALG
jgi:hypothetical protein